IQFQALGAGGRGIGNTAVTIIQDGADLNVFPVDIKKCAAHAQLLVKEITVSTQFIVNDGIRCVVAALFEIERQHVRAAATKALGNNEVDALLLAYFKPGAEFAQYFAVFAAAAIAVWKKLIGINIISVGCVVQANG